MIVNLVVLTLLAAGGYFGYKHFLADKLDSPRNNPAVKGLEKAEVKEAIKENETKVKTLKDEVKALEKERKDILAGSDADKAERAQEKLEAKQEKQNELAEIEANLTDLKIVDKGG
jgi:vacuolar-type H+-ATPase subunit I/STV1